jgi:hypothetical protein
MTDHNDITPAPADNSGRFLRAAMAEQHINVRKLSTLSQIDERTILKVLDGKNSRDTTKEAIAQALNMPVTEVWPDVAVRSAVGVPAVRTRVFPSRAEVPSAFWGEVFSAASERIDILVYGGTFLFDSVPSFPRILTDAADRGVSIRFAVGDPASAAVHERGGEEGLGVDLASRCRMTLRHLAPLTTVEGVEVRVHGTPLYTSMFFADNVVYANHHIYRLPAGDNPVIELARTDHPDLFDKYAETFAHVWALGTPVHTTPRY